jgi:predicted secreted Zn-dependent protease
MLSLLILLAAAQAQAPAATPAPGTPSAAPARAVQDLPGTTIQYYDVAGRDARTIQKNLKKILSTPNSTAARGYDWALGMSINRRTEGTTCTVTSAKATLKANAYLPRLTEEARLPA